jgi:hypothetical protein
MYFHGHYTLKREDASIIACAQGGQLRASVAFPALALFNLLREPIRILPMSITGYISAFVALKRLQQYVEVRPEFALPSLNIRMQSRRHGIL